LTRVVALRAGLVFLATVAAASCRRADPPPNLVLVVVDTLRQDHLAAYGYARETAPVLSRLAGESAVLDGLSVTSWTKPAVASLLTGLHPLRHRVIAGQALPADAITLAERLRARGYRTLGVSANRQVSSPFGFGQGFDELVTVSGTFPPAEEVNRAVLGRLDTLTPPFFLYVHYVDPHAPYDPLTSWDGSPLAPTLLARRPLGDDVLEPRRFGPRSEGLVRDAVDLYDGEIRRADRAIGELLQALSARRLLSSAVTVVVADHGEEFEEHSRMGHGLGLHGEVVGVPFFVHAPGRVKAGVRHGRASLLDLVPTVIDLLGDPAPLAGLDGVDLAPFLRAGRRYDDSHRIFLLHLDVPGSTALALVSGAHKLLLSRSPYARELFDLALDPDEKQDRFGDADSRQVVAKLGRALAERHNALVDRALKPVEVSVDSGLREALAAVGYLSLPGSQPLSIPSRIAPVDPDAPGLLGWESPHCGPCARLADPAAVGQLLDGWYGVELGGRWSGPTAAVLLGDADPAADRVVVEGIDHEPEPVRFQVTAGEDRPVDQQVSPGPFAVSIRLSSRAHASRVLVRLTRPLPFVPARHGLHDDRTLGLFVTSICLRGPG
jgi:Sulfatase